MIQVRDLLRGEVPRLRQMLRLFGEVFEDLPTYTGAPPDDGYLERLLSRDDFVAIEAREGERTVGALTGYVLHKFEQARAELYIYDLAVDAAFRRRGIATAMIERVRQVARERGIHVIFVQADHGDDPAIALYTKLGMREDVLHFDIVP